MAAGGPQPQANPQPQQPNNGQFAPVLQNRPVQIAVGIALLILIIGAIFFFVMNSSKDLGPFKPLVKGVDQGRGLEIASQLKSRGIETEIVPADVSGVEIQVREKQFDDAVLELARSDLLLTDDFKLFDKTDWAASDYEKRVKYMRAVGGELSRLISRMDGIRWAKAHVTIPPEKLFTSRYIKDKTSASVTIEMEPGRVLSSNHVSSIQSLVTGYVPEIEPGMISIIDTKGRLYASAFGDEGDGDWATQSVNINSNIERRVQAYLDGMVGAGKSQVAVSTRIVNQKTTQNITNFKAGAIGTQEYSEEALGDAARGGPYTGIAHQNNGAPPPRPVTGYHSSRGSELVDPRLRKKSHPNEPHEYREHFEEMDENYNATVDQGDHSDDGSLSYPDASQAQSPYQQTSGLYDMNQVNRQGNMQPSYQNQHGQDLARYVCAEGDEVCKRNYRRHNFAIQSYPSYEQTKIETPPGRIQQIKVSAVIEEGSLPVSVNRLKAGIAAAADPAMSPGDVEIILRPIQSETKNEKPNKNQVVLFNDDGSPKFQWWWVIVILILVIIVFMIFRAIGALLFGKPKTFRDRVPFPTPTPEPSRSSNPSPFERLDFDRQKQQPFNGQPNVSVNQTQTNQPIPNTQQQPIPQQQNIPTPTQTIQNNEQNIPAPTQQSNAPQPPQESVSFDEEIPSPSQQGKNVAEDLPFDLNDELGIEESPAPRPTRQTRPNVRNQPRPKPEVFIEDES